MERQRASWIFVAITVGIAVLLAVIVIATAYQRSFAIWFVIGVSVAWIVFRLDQSACDETGQARGRAIFANCSVGPSQPASPWCVNSGYRSGNWARTVCADCHCNGFCKPQPADLQHDSRGSAGVLFPWHSVRSVDEFHQIVDEIGGVTEVEVMPYIPGRITQIKGLDPLDALVNEDGRWIVDDGGERSFSYTAEPLKDVKIIAGDWWPPDYAGEPLLSIHEEVADNFDVGIGDEITLNILGREITGKVRIYVTLNGVRCD